MVSLLRIWTAIRKQRTNPGKVLSSDLLYIMYKVDGRSTLGRILNHYRKKIAVAYIPAVKSVIIKQH